MFEYIRFNHRKKLSKEQLINFDLHAKLQRSKLRKWHKTLRANGRKNNSSNEQLLFSEEMKKKAYNICLNVNMCAFCILLNK